MRQLILFFFGFCVIYFSCKKHDVQEPNPPSGAEMTKIPINDPNGISAGLKIFHASTIKAVVPKSVSSTSSPKLDPNSDGQHFYAVPGGYVAIKPAVTSGYTGGYYFQVKGANSYFKIDYSKPRGERYNTADRALPKVSKNIVPDNKRAGDADSLIILKIPDSIQAETFCAFYYLWDDQNNVSDSIQVCVTITEKGGGPAGDIFVGSWNMTGIKADTNRWDRGVLDSTKFSLGPFFCVADTISNSCLGCTPFNIFASYELTTIYRYVYRTDGSFVDTFSQVQGRLNFSASSCTHLIYDTTVSTYVFPGVWSYNDTKKMLIVIFDVDKAGETATRFKDFTVLENTDSKLLLSYTDPYDFPYLFEMEKQ